MGFDEYLATIALKEALNLLPNSEFTIRDLFRLSEWEIVPQSVKLQAGLRFYEMLTKNNLLNSSIIELEHLPDNTTVYKKI